MAHAYVTRWMFFHSKDTSPKKVLLFANEADAKLQTEMWPGTQDFVQAYDTFDGRVVLVF